MAHGLAWASAQSPMESRQYRGRLAPSPTGYLHLGHAKTFWTAHERARSAGGALVLRNEDLDGARTKPEFVQAFVEDLQWFGVHWSEGPDIGGPYGPYNQSERMQLYRNALRKLEEGGFVFPCTCSRKDIMAALSAPHQGEEEPVYPGTCRGKTYSPSDAPITAGAGTDHSSDVIGCCNGNHRQQEHRQQHHEQQGHQHQHHRQRQRRQQRQQQQQQQQQQQISWRFRVPDGTSVSFVDGHFGLQVYVAGRDFGDFVVWRGHDDAPSYQLACAVDDVAMQITEVVRGADLMMSTARQLLLLRALGLPEPRYFHCPLVLDKHGVRLAKRHDALSLRALRQQGVLPEELRRGWELPAAADHKE